MNNIIIAGDICPVANNLIPFKNGDLKNIYNDILVEFENCDLAIGNLECPLIVTPSPIKKNGPHLGVDSECVNGLPVHVANLANNHIMDHGPDGLMNTIQKCREKGITTVGAGKDLQAAKEIVIKQLKNIRIGILGVAENEFSIAKNNKPGANPLDTIHFIRTIDQYKATYDYLIILVHAGIGNYPLPSPRLMEMCRFMADMGANAVICQHSHCPGCYENYRGAYIVYGQGNFIFNLSGKKDKKWNTGFLIKLLISDDNKNHDMKLIPYTQNINKAGVRKLTGNEYTEFMQTINDRSGNIKNMAFVEEQWLNFCKNETKNYFDIIFNIPLILRKIDRRIRFLQYFYNYKYLIEHENMLKTESHREVVETILEDIRLNHFN